MLKMTNNSATTLVGIIKKARISQQVEFLAFSCGSFVTNSTLAITRGGYETPTTRRFHGIEFLPTRHMPLWFSAPKRARAISATRQPPESRKNQQPSRLSRLKQYVTPPPAPYQNLRAAGLCHLQQRARRVASASSCRCVCVLFTHGHARPGRGPTERRKHTQKQP